MADTLGKLGRAITAGTAAFRREYMTDSQEPEGQYDTYAGRIVRYRLLWAMYENTAYEDVHRWAKTYKAAYAMYRYVRSIYNPSMRIGNFWATHLMGGGLDPAAGDGTAIPSALPILVPPDNQMQTELRQSIAQIWDWSNWATNKDLWTMYGAVLGDVGLQITDSPERGKVYLEVIHPSMFREIELDEQGNVKYYELAYAREDPENAGRTVTYSEKCYRGTGDEVIFETYREDNPYAWDNRPESWQVPYGFVPMVFTRHIITGAVWGRSELHGGLAKIREADDIASKLSDHIRKSVDPPWLFNFAKPRRAGNKQDLGEPVDTALRPQAGREEIPAIYASEPAAKGQPLVAEMNYQGVILHLSGIVRQIEQDYPELRFDNLRLEGTISGEALRAAREPATAKVLKQRAPYDDSLKRAQAMAVAIAGFRGIAGFEGFGLDSYAAGDLTHAIGSRPVFEVDAYEQLEVEQKFWTVAQAAVSAGASLPGFLRSKGWTDARIKTIITQPEGDQGSVQNQATGSRTDPREAEQETEDDNAESQG